MHFCLRHPFCVQIFILIECVLNTECALIYIGRSTPLLLTYFDKD